MSFKYQTGKPLPEDPQLAARLKRSKNLVGVAAALIGIGLLAIVLGATVANVFVADSDFIVVIAGATIVVLSTGLLIVGVMDYAGILDATREAEPRLARLLEAKESLNVRPPRLHLELLVPHQGGYTYRVTTQALCNTARERVVRAGGELYVRVNPAEPFRLEVDWQMSAAHLGLPYGVVGE
ncbi:MAG TPA: hypothetical protein ENK57_12980 [Polyangiaceae bacterium]|nr:hypothetical protein [Polyangiaceae bacterium]